MSNIPLRNPDPPVHWVKVPVCPECGCDELGEILIEKSYNRIERWDMDGQPMPAISDQEDIKVIAKNDPKYYCCGCGDEFNDPKITEEPR